MVKILLICFILVTFTWAKLPDYIHVCHRKDPHVTKCILESTEAIRPYLVQGIPELDIPKLEPLKLTDVEVSRYSENLEYKITAKNIFVTGLGKAQPTKFRLDLPNLTFYIDAKIALVGLEADVDVNARIFVVPIQGKWKLFANGTHATGKAVLKAELRKVNGIDRINFTSASFNLQVANENIRMHVESAFGQNAVLDVTVNGMIDQYKDLLASIAKPVGEEKLKEMLLDMGNKICSHFDYNEIFPE